jgi:hypothetical protein
MASKNENLRAAVVTGVLQLPRVLTSYAQILRNMSGPVPEGKREQAAKELERAAQLIIEATFHLEN